MNNNKNYIYFKNEESNFAKMFPDEYIVISEEKVLFHAKDLNEVIDYVRGLKAETYIIQKCGNNETNNVQMFHTRVTF